MASPPPPRPTPEFIREALVYEPMTGVLTWKVRPLSHFDDGPKRAADHTMKLWNSRLAGSRAGAVHHEGYIVIEVCKRPFPGHVLAWTIATGAWPKEEIDHK